MFNNKKIYFNTEARLLSSEPKESLKYDFPELQNASDSYMYLSTSYDGCSVFVYDDPTGAFEGYNGGEVKGVKGAKYNVLGRFFQWGGGYTMYNIFLIFYTYRNGRTYYYNPKHIIERHTKCKYLTSNEIILRTYANNCGFSWTYIPNYVPYPKGLANKEEILKEILKK